LQKLKTTADENGISFEKVFGSIEGTNAALALTGETGAKATEIMNGMTNGANKLDAAFKSQNEKFSQASKILMNNLNLAMIELGSRILPLLNSGIKAAIPLLQGMVAIWDAMGKPLQYIVLTMGALVAAGGPVLLLIGYIPKIQAGITAITTATAGLNISLGALAGKITIAVGLFQQMYKLGGLLEEKFKWAQKIGDFIHSSYKVLGSSVGVDIDSIGIDQPAGLSQRGQQMQAQMAAGNTTIINNPMIDSEGQMQRLGENTNNNTAPAKTF